MSDVNNPEIVVEDYLLIIDVTLGVGWDDHTESKWGYFSEEEASKKEPAFGSLDVIQNRTDIAKIRTFYWIDQTGPGVPLFIFGVSPYLATESSTGLEDLFKNKDLYIIVDGLTYNLGKPSNFFTPLEHGYFSWYESNAKVQKLSSILKQTGVTKRLYINWK
ncbi:hypothetical protein [Xenorhabdus entomophaga]|uniref:DUF7823 domain-containing protein n=1 Tax=Xenorhabdus entomophaga TaxID=3136257 RepID=UPI0030F46FA0